jgi:hypothetical protein
MNISLERTKWQTTLVLWAVAWALALVGSSFVFKGNPIKDSIQSALFVVGIAVWLWLLFWRSRQKARLPR